MKWVKNNKNALLWALTIIVIILIIVFSKPGDKAEEAIVDEESTETANKEAGESVSIASVDGNVYDFSGVKWEFDTEDPSVPEGQTWVKMRFADFSRNGSVINLRNPYKLGFHPGTCEEVDFVDTTGVEGIPLAYAKCTDGATTREFVVLQKMDTVVVKYMDTKEGVSNPAFIDLYSIDVTTIVK